MLQVQTSPAGAASASVTPLADTSNAAGSGVVSAANASTAGGVDTDAAGSDAVSLAAALACVSISFVFAFGKDTTSAAAAPVGGGTGGRTCVGALEPRIGSVSKGNFVLKRRAHAPSFDAAAGVSAIPNSSSMPCA